MGSDHHHDHYKSNNKNKDKNKDTLTYGSIMWGKIIQAIL